MKVTGDPPQLIQLSTLSLLRPALADAGFQMPGPRLQAPPRGSKVAVEKGRQLGLGEGSDLGGLHVSALEKHQGGDAADAVFWGCGRIFVYV